MLISTRRKCVASAYKRTVIFKWAAIYKRLDPDLLNTLPTRDIFNPLRAGGAFNPLSASGGLIPTEIFHIYNMFNYTLDLFNPVLVMLITFSPT